jgi:hypothetical protein
MGDSLPPPAEFDLVDSFARRRGADAEIVLAEPKTDLAGGGLTVRLALGRTKVEAEAEASETADGRRLVVRVPRSRLTDGAWSLAVVRPGGDVAPLAARLLVQGERPLVLLWGANAGTTYVPLARAKGARATALRTGARAADRVLDVLPEKQAVRARRKARKLARRVLG